jgi:hypothetical protein
VQLRQITNATAMGAGTTHWLETEGMRWYQIMDVTTQGARTTHILEVEESVMRSGHGCECKGSKNDAQTGGGEAVRWRQITDATGKGAGTTHWLKTDWERDGVRSQMLLQSE